ncbi:hypothetical protein ISCGN_007185 [Ixodes scapularis]
MPGTNGEAAALDNRLTSPLKSVAAPNARDERPASPHLSRPWPRPMPGTNGTNGDALVILVAPASLTSPLTSGAAPDAKNERYAMLMLVAPASLTSPLTSVAAPMPETNGEAAALASRLTSPPTSVAAPDARDERQIFQINRERGSSQAMENALHSRDRVGVQDLVLLEDFESEKACVDNLQKRFKEDLIYWRTGFILRRRGTLALDKPCMESATKGPLPARETPTLMPMTLLTGTHRGSGRNPNRPHSPGGSAAGAVTGLPARQCLRLPGHGHVV